MGNGRKGNGKENGAGDGNGGGRDGAKEGWNGHWDKEEGPAKADPSSMFLGFEERALTKAERRGLELQEIQVILAEKRTSLSLLRTGITIYALPLSVLTFLVATSNYYDIIDTLPIFLPLMALVSFLVVLGTYFVYRSLLRIRMHDERITELRKEHRFLEKVVDATEENTILHVRPHHPDIDDDYED